MEIADRNAEEQAAEVTEDGIAKIAVEEGHGSGLDSAAKAIADNEIGARVEGGEKARQVAEVVTVVGVGHEDVFSVGCFESGEQGGPVASNGDVDDACAFVGRDGEGAVGASVVGDDDFAGDAGCRDGGKSLADADGEGFSLVQAGHHDGYGEGWHQSFRVRPVYTVQSKAEASRR